MSEKKGTYHYSTPREHRHRKGVELMLSEAAREALDHLAEDDPEGRSRSAIVEELIWAACGLDATADPDSQPKPE